jgi:ubiquinone/menaquinone biosynthesis C-methylase UbiE
LVLNGVAVASIVRAFFGAQTLPIAIQHAAIAEVNRRAGIWQLAYVNRREHLPKSILSPLQGQTNAVASEASLEIEELARVEEVYNRLGTRSLAGIPQAGRAQRMRDLLRWVKIPPEMRILDVGTGAGQLATMLAEDGAAEVVGIDVSPVTLEAAEYQRLARPSTAASRVTYRLAPAHSLPFSDERFDAEFCRLVLQHARKPDRALQELVRVLKTGGLFVLAELLGVEDPVRRATQTAIEERRNGAHITVRTADQLRRLLTAAGLTIEAEKTAVFDRELDDWLSDMDADQASRAAVRDMMEAGIETDASGLHVRRQGSKLLFEQRFLYIRAVKK